MTIDHKVVTSNELTRELLDNLVSTYQSFKVVAVADIGKVVNEIEGRIEKAGLSCRVYTENRSTVLAAALIPTPWTVVGGCVAGIGIGIHNLSTLNPDYEIGKNKLAGTIMVTYKRSLS